jgi:hypothetical protein
MNYIDSNILATMGVGSASPASRGSAYQNKEATQSYNAEKDLSSQQVTSIIENAIRQYALTALDLYISEQVGQTPLIVDDEAKNAINELEGPGFVGDDNIVNIDWQAYYDRIQTWTVTVELSIRRDQLKDEKRKDLQDTATVMAQTADPNDPAAMARKNAVEDELLKDMAPEASKSADNSVSQQPQSLVPVGGEPTPVGQ